MNQTIEQINQIEQARRNLGMQKQQLETQLLEIETALRELVPSSESYIIIGNIMVKKEKETIKKDLEGKQELLTIRKNQIETQEKKLGEKSSQLRQGLSEDKA